MLKKTTCNFSNSFFKRNYILFLVFSTYLCIFSEGKRYTISKNNAFLHNFRNYIILFVCNTNREILRK